MAERNSGSPLRILVKSYHRINLMRRYNHETSYPRSLDWRFRGKNLYSLLFNAFILKIKDSLKILDEIFLRGTKFFNPIFMDDGIFSVTITKLQESFHGTIEQMRVERANKPSKDTEKIIFN